MSGAQILEETAKLVDAWRERHCSRALEFVLQGFPLHCIHTDAWFDLRVALNETQKYAQSEMTPEERVTLDKLVSEINSWNW